MTSWRVQLFQLDFGAEERAAVEEVLRSGWITMGPRTAEFEAAFSQFLGGGARSVAVSSGTAALHLALLALDVGPGDEVLLPALTFVADLNVILMVGATPVPVDCESLEDWNLSVADVARRITPRTRAVLAVHYAGFPCRMEELTRLCREKGIRLIEDAAHAVGATLAGRSCGTFGDIGCFSFFTNKNLSVGEGGMLVTGDPGLYEKARLLRSHGMTTLTLDRHQGRASTYDVVRPGLNYRLDEIRAALGLVQLRKLPEANARRRDLTRLYHSLLAGRDDVIPPFPAPRAGVSSCHIHPLLLPSTSVRDRAMHRLKEEGIQTSIHYPSFRSFSACRELRFAETPLAEAISGRELTLPLYPSMTEEEVALVAGGLARVLA